MVKTIVEAKDICLTYHEINGETLAVDRLSFTVSKGEFVSIVGPSGCGKSSGLSMLAGLIAPSAGQLTIEGGRPGYMLQRDHLLDWRTIEGNIVLGLQVQGRLNPETREKAMALLETYGLADFAKSYPGQLSGGMRQKVALIRTLACSPDLLLLDEPFSALDYQTRLQVGDDIGQIIRNEKKSALLVTHDLSEAISLADRVIVLSRRPAAIIQTIPLIFHLEEDTPMNRRNAPEFKSYFNLIWKELNQDEKSS